jgi:hypothetical protein
LGLDETVAGTMEGPSYGFAQEQHESGHFLFPFALLKFQTKGWQRLSQTFGRFMSHGVFYHPGANVGRAGWFELKTIVESRLPINSISISAPNLEIQLNKSSSTISASVSVLWYSLFYNFAWITTTL